MLLIKKKNFLPFFEISMRNVSCLEDRSKKLANKSSVLPGLSYDFDRQCQFAFGKNASYCLDRKVGKCDDLINL